MKKAFFISCLLVVVITLCAPMVPIGLDSQHAIKKNSGCGYTVIEFGLGVDCNGDTVKLTKSRGFQRLASRQDSSYREE